MDKTQITKFIFGSITNILKVQDFLEQNPDLDPRDYINQQNSNILHHLSFYDHRQLIKIYVAHTIKLIRRKTENSKAIYKKDPSQEITAWVNQKNVEGFTPILYAAYNGHVELMKDLEEYGANVNITNSTFLNVLHMAAQNNKVSSMIYFSGKVDINSTDQKGHTPLHWAAYSGSQDVVAYILANDSININAVDKEGQTPLILATSYGNTKIVRRLLIKGASRSIRNLKGKNAIEIAREQKFTNIQKLLNVKYSVGDLFKFYYNVKLEYRPKTRKFTIPIVFLVSSLTALFILNGLIQFVSKPLFISQISVISIMFLLYFSLLLPSKTRQKQDINNYINEPRKYCFQCEYKKPKRSYHCDICGVCIEQYDHHCTWINNCVGKRNIARFIIFIFFLILSLAFIGIVSIWMQLHLLFDVGTISNVMKMRKTQIDQQYAKIIQGALLFINIIISIFFFPVLLLFVVQVKNLCLNKTTYERIRGDNSSVKEQLRNKQNRGIIKNCKAMCGSTRQSFSNSEDSFKEQLLSSR